MNSASASHLLSQFEAACRSALSSSEKTRAQLRARAAKQRFPVAVWVKQLDALQHKCIKLSNKHNRRQSLIRPRMELVMDEPDEINPQPAIKLEPLNHETFQRKPSVLRRNAVPWSTHAMPQLPEEGDMLGSDDAPRLHRQVSLGSRRGPHRAREHLNELHDLQEEDDSIGSEHSFEMHSQDVVYAEQQYCSGQAPEEQDFDRYMRSYEHQNENRYSLSTGEAFQYENHRQEYRNRYETRGLMHHQNDSVSSIESSRSYNDFSPERMRPLPTPQPLQSRGRPDSFDTDHDDYMAPTPGLSPPGSARPYLSDSGRQSRLSVLSLGDLERDERAQHSTIKKGETMFTDANGAAKRAFVSELQKGFTPAESKKKMCIETYLIAAEKEFFESLKSEQIHGNSKKIRRRSVMLGDGDIDPNDRLTGMQRIMAMRGLGWPLYTVLIALGQVLAANTYQLTLLGGLHNTTAQLYLINFVFIAMSVVWYVLYRRFWAMYTLSIPFLLYSIAFILIGLPYFKVFGGPKSAQYISNAASTLYAAASASGSLFFALNFGSEGGVETEGMVFRACIVQGLQQLWSAGLWYWGHGLDTSSAAINKLYAQSVPSGVAIIVWIIGCFLFIVFLAMLTGLPRYYRQTPGVIPAFYRSLYRRKVIVWFLFSQILSNFWLALPYGSSWYYLWSSQHIKPWLIALMIIFYFVIIWAVVMLAMRHFSKTHTWVPVIFALGTIAPRYFAEYWAVSSIGAYLPWATSATGSAFLGRALWLWLTVLDSCQGVGLGIMLLQTLIRDHVAFTLVCAQMIGAFTTVIAKAADISFSNYLVSFSSWSPGDGPGPFGYPGFWLCLICQLLIPFGFFLLFRKSQLAF